MGKKIIELKNLSKNFGDNQVLKGIDLNIYENEFLTLLGPSGCGKTTILRIIAGFEEPSHGQVMFNGEDIAKVPAYKREVNTVFQKYALFPHMTVLENVIYGLKFQGIKKKKAREMAKTEKMKRRKKSRFKKKGIEKLNKGKKQKKGSSSKSERVLFSFHETRELMVQSMHLMLLGSSVADASYEERNTEHDLYIIIVCDCDL